jgi:hypothetical protein
MSNIKNVLLTSINAIDRTTQLFYQQNIPEGYQELETTLVQLTQTINEIFTYKSEGNQIDIEESQLIQSLNEAMKALEEKDTTLLSDILQYELKELFEKASLSL